ncbi:MAG TPA: type II secretion system protein GspM [Burkholderiaceae bacterium]|nr:type II secretion system protein GspM [Burkholderiaceae bacterium]
MRRRLQRWWTQRSPRERWLAIVVILCAVVAALDVGVLGPQRAQSNKLARQLDAAQDRLQQVQAQAAQQASESETELRQRRLNLEQRRARAMQVISDAQIDLIAPQEMTRQLEAILVRHPTLRIMGMNTSSPKPLVENASAGNAAIFQHGLEVQIEGPYLDLLGYLDALERAPYRLYWRELEIKVGANGVPVTRLVFFTLSRESAWLRL